MAWTVIITRKNHKDGHTLSDKRSPEMINGKYQGKSEKMKLYMRLYCPDVFLYYPAINCSMTSCTKGGIFVFDNLYCTEL